MKRSIKTKKNANNYWDYSDISNIKWNFRKRRTIDENSDITNP